jgi:hypothetical protein
MTYKQVLSTRIVIPSLLIIFAFALFSVTVWSGTRKIQDKTWEQRKAEMIVENIRVENFTKGLTPISVDIDKERELITLTLRNDYDKIVTGYEVSIGEVTVQTESLNDSSVQEVLHPRDTRKEVYALQDNLDKFGIAIVAVILEDGTTDGESNHIQEIREYRQGMKIQREHVLLLLEKIAKQSMNKIPAALNSLVSQLAPMSESDERQLPPNVRFGIHDEKARILKEINNAKRIISAAQMQSSNQTVSQGKFISLVDSYRRLVQKY